MQAGREGVVGLSGRLDAAVSVGVLDNGSTILSVREVSLGVNTADKLNADSTGTGLEEGDRLGVDIIGDEELVLLSLEVGVGGERSESRKRWVRYWGALVGSGVVRCVERVSVALSPIFHHPL